MEDLRRGSLPAKALRDLELACPPLCKPQTKPIRQDLTGFWKRIQRQLPGLCADFKWEKLGPDEIDTLGPYLLGEGAWNKLPKRSYYSWEEFRRAVDSAVGLSGTAMRMAFMGLMKERGESDESFIMRCEEERVHNEEDGDVCLGLFFPRTSSEF